jgi:hypothetical protein
MIKDRIKQYLEFKGISKYNFYKKTGMSNGALDKSGTIGADKCELIYYAFPDLNLSWLITGEGEMLQKDQGGKPPPDRQADNECKQEVEFYKRLLEKKEAELREAYKEIGRLEPYKKQTEGIDLPNQPKLTEKGENTNEKSQS